MSDPSLCALCHKHKSTCWSEHYGIKLPFCSVKCSNLLCAALSYGADDSFHQGTLIGVKPGEQAPTSDQTEELIKRLQNFQIGWEGQRARDAATVEAPPGQEPPMAWKSLPFDIRLMILTGVPLLEAIKLSGVNRQWRQTLSSDHTWRAFYQRSIVGAIGGTDKLVLPTWREQTIAYLKMFDFIVINKNDGRIERFVPIRSGPSRPILVLQHANDGKVRIVFGTHLRKMIGNRPIDYIAFQKRGGAAGYEQYERDAHDPALFKESHYRPEVGPRTLVLYHLNSPQEPQYHGEHDDVTNLGELVVLMVGWGRHLDYPASLKMPPKSVIDLSQTPQWSWGGLHPQYDVRFVARDSGKLTVVYPHQSYGPPPFSASLSLEIVGPSKEDYRRREITTIAECPSSHSRFRDVRLRGRVTPIPWDEHDLPAVSDDLPSIEDSLEKVPAVAIGRIQIGEATAHLSISAKVRIGVPIFPSTRPVRIGLPIITSNNPARIVAVFCAVLAEPLEAKFVRHDFDLPNDKDVTVTLPKTLRFVPPEGAIDREWLIGVANRTIGFPHNADAEIEYHIYTPFGRKTSFVGEPDTVNWYIGRALQRSPPVFLPIYPTYSDWPGLFDTLKGGPDGIATEIADQTRTSP